ncbi:hypothetical protein GCM10023196_036190 [Actinoallomurus vinaceus]|uniref:HTH cro/C1-type domain-containing protein n=1 Tax=Actinoallomurus vinaceus TaxID=1080074 RepID=A0ABP8UAT9_9ACTN
MSERPEPPPEGQLITAALKRAGLSARAAAKRAGISDARWRQITSGYQTVSGTRVPVRAPAETLARMAQVSGATAEQLRQAGRADAAEALGELPEIEAPKEEPTVAELAAQLRDLQAQFDALQAKFEERRDAS